MKIIFIEPKGPNLHIFSRFKMPRLGCVLLATIARDLGHDAKVFVEEIADIDWREVEKADLVGISSITSTAPRAYAFADAIRKLGIEVVMGGPHVTFMPTEASEHADYVLRGEAEISFVELLEFIQGKRKIKYVHNLVYHCNGEAVRTQPLSTPVDVKQNPSPDFSLIHEFYNTSAFVGSKRVIPIQLSRGCPHDCSFCSVTGMFGRKMRYRDTDDVMAELMRYNNKKYHVFFYDDNFAASSSIAKQLLYKMAKAGTKFNWSTQMRADAAKDRELLRLMKATRCDTVYVGVESVSPESLKQAHKKQDLDATREYLRRYHNYGINVHGMFIMGFDADTHNSWKSTVEFARSARISTIQALILTPLPGTKTFEEFEKQGKIMFKDWSLYDSHHVVFKHPTMTPEQLQQSQIQAHNLFYSKYKFIHHFLNCDFTNAIIVVYARELQKEWLRKNSLYMKALELLKPTNDFQVTVDMRMPVSLT